MRTRFGRAWLVTAVAATVVWQAVGGGCAPEPTRTLRAARTRLRDWTAELRAAVTVTDAVDPGRPGCAGLLGAGWFPPELGGDGMTYAWTAAETARVTLPILKDGPGHVVVRGYGLRESGFARRVGLCVNGRDLGTQPLPAQLTTLVYSVPDGLLRAGGNDLALRVDRLVRPADLLGVSDARPLGMLVDFIAFVPSDGSDPAAALDPYTDSGPHLSAGRAACLRLACLSGAELRLEWDSSGAEPGDSLVIEVAPELGAPPRLRAAWPAGPRASAKVRMTLPAGLPAQSLLCLRMTREGGAPPRGRIEVPRLALARAVRSLDVVLIVIDTLRPDYLGCYGDGRGLSPAIDSLACDGVLFENAVATAPITGPSHASLFTSRWACETGVRNNFAARPDPSLPLLAEILNGLGYQTLGTVSISSVAASCGFARGFCEYADSLGIGFLAPADTVLARVRRQLDRAVRPLFVWAHFAEPHEPYDAHGLADAHADLLLDGKAIARVPTSIYTPTAVELGLPPRAARLLFTSSTGFHVRALELKGLDGLPPSLDPPDPPRGEICAYQVTIGAGGARRVRMEFALNDHVRRGGELQARYAREVQTVDARVGELLDELRGRGLYDDSLIIFTADHGEALGERDLVGHVENLYEVLLHVPLIIKPPRQDGFRPGARRRDLASLVDILPTVLGRLGQPPLPGARGRDLCAGGTARGPHDAVFAETHRPQAQRTLYALRGQRYKLIYEPARDAWEFYDLARDPHEEHDLYDGADREVHRWRVQLRARLAELGLDSAEASVPQVIDGRSRRALRALGY